MIASSVLPVLIGIRFHMENTIEIQNQHIDDWIKDDEKFIPTIATNTIIERLRTDSFVLVVGCSGNGKSSIIRHIALKLWKEEQYEIIPIVRSPGSIFESLNTKGKQIFVVDDLCGKVIINSQSVDAWFWPINKFMKLINTPGEDYNEDIADVKFLLATGQHIYNDRIFQKLKLPIKYVCNLTEWPLTNEEKQKMIKKYVTPEAATELLQTFKSDEAYFPLLCKIAERKTNNQNIKLFSNFEEFIKQDLMTLKRNNDFQFCTITLCALLNNNFKKNILNEDYESDFDRQAFDDICLEFKLRHNEAKRKVKKQLQNLEEMYMTKTENYCHFIHNKVFLIALVVCGQTFLTTFIKFVRSSVIAERFRFRSIVAINNEDYIIIDSDNAEERYFDRLLFDLKQGDTYSTFHNSQLYSDSYRFKFCSYCNTRKQKVSELLKHFCKKGGTEIVTFAERNYEDYIEFTKQHHFFSHKMRKPLIESAWEGYTDIVEMLLKSDYNVNEADKFGRTALFVACLLGKTQVVKVLLDYKADHSLCDEKGQTPLLVASGKGYEDIVNVLLQSNAKVDICDVEGNSPLLVASSENHLSTIQVLLDRITDFPKCNKLGESPVFVACMNGGKDIVRYLLSFLAAYISTPDNVGRSPLFIACSKGHHGVVKLLLENKADILRCDQSKRSPLFIASYEGYEDIVHTLIQNKAEINQCNEKGITPLLAASERGQTETAKILVDNGADLDASDNEKRTPLYAACKGGFMDIIKHLLENGSSVSDEDLNGNIPLLEAIENGYTEIAQFLINRGAEINQCDNKKKTPLHLSVIKGNIDVVKALINKGALQNLTDDDNHTPFDLACKQSCADIVKLLNPDK
ncbi:Hypothetical predicted protein [Mytilus galloprovincialis]|uniref:Novel STAND NTPase 3 domain-containing protein n=1 Tax=Mytilus galloprovincialis TaxID=29158 RepID=A0A8B6GVJ8_MYTGA|nr:Hypothetical predicted protein [Mytilus galloprovincialis]